MRSLIGVAMRVYRKSPFYPRLGRTLAKVLARLPSRPGPVVRDIGGVKFELDLREVIDSSLYYAGTFEEKAEAVITSCLAPGMVAIDVGANFGYHTFRMAKAVGPAGRIWAIEPTTWGMNKLRRNADLNAFTNVDFLKIGLADRDLGPTEIAFQASYRLDGALDERRETVDLKTVDTLVTSRDSPRIAFIKLDVDGFEGKVIRGALKTLERDRPTLFLEIGPSHMKRIGDDSRDLTATLRELGYRFETEDRAAVADVDALCARIADGCSVNLLALPG
jgi:FkbM family methyltransferase